MYRVNYGNGQVSRDFDTRQEAEAHIASMDQYRDFAFVQRYETGSADEPGDWFSCRPQSDQAARRRSRSS